MFDISKFTSYISMDTSISFEIVCRLWKVPTREYFTDIVNSKCCNSSNSNSSSSVNNFNNCLTYYNKRVLASGLIIFVKLTFLAINKGHWG